MRLWLASRRNMKQCHPLLKRLVIAAAEAPPLEFQISKFSVRTLEQQRALVENGSSLTMKSRHLLAHIKGADEPVSAAVDFYPVLDGGPEFEDHAPYKLLGPYFEEVAEREGIPIVWGGRFDGWFDGPHLQLPWSQFPITAKGADG